MTTMVCRMTDEELDALCDGAPTPVGSPYLDRLDPASRALARLTAQRSLMVRRLLEPDGELRDDLVHRAERGSTVPGHPTGLVRIVLALRASAPVVAVLHRCIGAAQDGSDEGSTMSRYLHVAADGLAAAPGVAAPGVAAPGVAAADGASAEGAAPGAGTVVVEDVTPAGVHTFGLATWSALARLADDFLVPPGAQRAGPGPAGPAGPTGRARPTGRAGPARAFTDPGDAARLLEALRRPTVLAETVVLHGAVDRAPEARTLALGPRGCFSGRPSPAGTRYREVGADALVQELVAEVAAARDTVAQAAATLQAAVG